MSDSTLFYDDSLPEAVRVVTERIPDADNACTYLRDGQGRLHVYIDGLHEPDLLQALEASLRSALAGYAPTHGPIVRTEQPLGEPSLIVVGARRVRYIERRFAGTDWAQKPVPLEMPPRLVFYSIKGGVGRTTALSVLATALARNGKRVLAVDLDLEAPGLGSILLSEQELPEFGALDWLAERAIQQSVKMPSDRLVATSQIGRDFGSLDVVPAFGRRCLGNPAGVLSKLSRIVVESAGPGGSETFGDRVHDLIQYLVNTKPYDAVLVDARAGLSEISAAPLLGLGADILFFMSDNSQSVATYTALLAHLQRFAPVCPDLSSDEDWRLRIKVVRGRVVNFGDPKAEAAFNDRCYEMFSSTIYDAEDNSDDLGTFNFAPEDRQAPHYAVQIAFDPRFQTFEPLAFAEQRRPDVTAPAFGAFVQWCLERLRIEDSA